MIRLLIDFALRNRIMVLSLALVLFIWGIYSFHNLPIEAYPDVADTYTQIITRVARSRGRRSRTANHGSAQKCQLNGVPAI